jgi:hypothetical protein
MILWEFKRRVGKKFRVRDVINAGISFHRHPSNTNDNIFTAMTIATQRE